MKTIYKKMKKSILTLITLLTISFIFFQGNAFAHCDSYDGPVIQDALKAIESGDVQPVLKWIEKDYEKEIVALFNKTTALKDQDEEIYEIVEKHFLETLVRVHREGEGAPFTGLKPAGTTSKIVVWSDEALAQGDVNELADKIAAHLVNEIQSKFERAVKTGKKKDLSVEDGRAFVEAYVDYTHYVEGIHGMIVGEGGHSH